LSRPDKRHREPFPSNPRHPSRRLTTSEGRTLVQLGAPSSSTSDFSPSKPHRGFDAPSTHLNMGRRRSSRFSSSTSNRCDFSLRARAETHRIGQLDDLVCGSQGYCPFSVPFVCICHASNLRDIRSETIFFTRTGAANAFDLVQVSRKTHDVAARGVPRSTSRRTASVQKIHRLCSQDVERPPFTRSGRSPKRVHVKHAASRSGARTSTKSC